MASQTKRVTRSKDGRNKKSKSQKKPVNRKLFLTDVEEWENFMISKGEYYFNVVMKDNIDAGGSWKHIDEWRKGSFDAKTAAVSVFYPLANDMGFASKMPSKKAKNCLHVFVKHYKQYKLEQDKKEKKNNNKNKRSKIPHASSSFVNKLKSEGKDYIDNGNDSNEIENESNENENESNENENESNENENESNENEYDSNDDATETNEIDLNASDTENNKKKKKKKKERDLSLKDYSPPKRSNNSMRMGVVVIEYNENDGYFSKLPGKSIKMKHKHFYSRFKGLSHQEGIDMIIQSDASFKTKNIDKVLLLPPDADKTDKNVTWDNVSNSSFWPAYGRSKERNDASMLLFIYLFFLFLFFVLFALFGTQEKCKDACTFECVGRPDILLFYCVRIYTSPLRVVSAGGNSSSSSNSASSSSSGSSSSCSSSYKRSRAEMNAPAEGQGSAPFEQVGCSDTECDDLLSGLEPQPKRPRKGQFQRKFDPNNTFDLNKNDSESFEPVGWRDPANSRNSVKPSNSSDDSRAARKDRKKHKSKRNKSAKRENKRKHNKKKEKN